MCNPVSKKELAYAIETTFALSNLAVVSVDDKKVGLVRSAQGKSGTARNRPLPQR